MRALITGGAGFVGHHLARALVGHGVEVAVLDTAARPAAFSADPSVEYYQGSVLDDALVRRLVPEADVVVHLAGIAEPMRYGSDPLATMDVNLTGSLNVVRRCADYGVPVVFSSTSEVYGINPELPWAEDANRVLGPVANVRWCYSTAKVAVEHYLDACRRQLGLRYTVVRLFNTYGDGLRGRVVDGFIRRALAGQPLIIHGDGRQTRCFCHIDDVTDALMRIVMRLAGGGLAGGGLASGGSAGGGRAGAGLADKGQADGGQAGGGQANRGQADGRLAGGGSAGGGRASGAPAGGRAGGGHTYNVGSDSEISIAELGRVIIELCASRSVLRLVPPSQLYDGYQDVPRRRPDIGAIGRDFGWAPTIGLRDGLQRMIATMSAAMEDIGAD